MSSTHHMWLSVSCEEKSYIILQGCEEPGSPCTMNEYLKLPGETDNIFYFASTSTPCQVPKPGGPFKLFSKIKHDEIEAAMDVCNFGMFPDEVTVAQDCVEMVVQKLFEKKLVDAGDVFAWLKSVRDQPQPWAEDFQLKCELCPPQGK